MTDPTPNEGPMMPVLRVYVDRLEKEWPHVKRDQILLSATILTATDTILRYADYLVRTATEEEKPKEQ